MKNNRNVLDVVFKILYLIMLVLIVFIAIYSGVKDLKYGSVFFWGAVVTFFLLKLIQYYIYHTIPFDFFDIEEIDVNGNVIDKLLNSFKLKNKTEVINEERFNLSTYLNKICSKGLMYVKSDSINDNKMLIIKKHLDDFNFKNAGYQIYLYLDVVNYTKEVEIMLKQYTSFDDRFKVVDLGFGDADTNILTLCYSSKDNKFRIGGTAFRYNMSDYKRMTKKVKKIVKK